MKSVLSIDFDYFQNVSSECLQFYPDGLDLPTELSTIVWSGKYATPKEKEAISNVTIMHDEIFILLSIIKHQVPNTPVYVTNSHVNIYSFICENIPLGEKFTLHNIDMHHDLLNNNETLDCGNWVNHIFKRYGRKNIDFKWIANPISLQAYGFDSDEVKALPILNSLSSIKEEKYDFIFLCRSDNWLPPHLDSYFDRVFQTIKLHFNKIRATCDVREPRNYSPLVRTMRSYWNL